MAMEVSRPRKTAWEGTMTRACQCPQQLLKRRHALLQTLLQWPLRREPLLQLAAALVQPEHEVMLMLQLLQLHPQHCLGQTSQSQW